MSDDRTPVHNPDRYRYFRLIALCGSVGSLTRAIALDDHWLWIATWAFTSVTVAVLMVLDRRDRLAARQPEFRLNWQPRGGGGHV